MESQPQDPELRNNSEQGTNYFNIALVLQDK